MRCLENLGRYLDIMALNTVSSFDVILDIPGRNSLGIQREDGYDSLYVFEMFIS